MILHIVNKSPFEHPAWQQCLRTLDEHDSVLLIEDGTLLLSNPSALNSLPPPERLFILGDDAKSRGIALNSAVASVADYGRFVELVALHAKSPSWC